MSYNLEKYPFLTFYSLNDDLDNEELYKQLCDFKEKGITGVFLHARAGLRVEYLSDEWFGHIGFCIKTCEEIGLSAWLYDENGWPSGFADFIVPNASKDFCQKELKFKYIDDADDIPDDPIGLYEIDGIKNTYKHINASEISLSGKVLAAYFTTNSNYTDLLNSDAVKEFIASTHDEYYRRFSTYFGNVIKGIFTDEPQMVHGGFPWSTGIESSFKNLFGYDIIDKLPLLFLDLVGSSKVRHDFWKLCSTLYRENYHKQIYDWCTDHKISLTGHMSSEDSTLSQMSTVGNVMANYMYYHIPGIDHLGNRLTSPVLQKQISSAARQLGKKAVLSETFGCAGWDASVSDCLKIWAWQSLSAVNLPCLHLSAYSIKGTRKRDYPQFYSYQLQWWNAFSELSRRMKDISDFVSEGEYLCNTLVIHPNTSIWCDGDPLGSYLTTSISGNFRVLTETLMKLQIQFDYGDEIMMDKIGKTEGNELIIGECRYSFVILPHITSLESGTLSLLKEYAGNGGKILVINSLPYMVDGIRNEQAYHFLSAPNVFVSSLVSNRLARSLSHNSIDFNITDANGNPHLCDIYSRITKTDKGYNIFVLNISDSDKKNISITFGENKRYFTLDPGRYRMIKWEDAKNQEEFVLAEDKRLIKPDSSAFTDFNSLVIDFASYSVNGSEFSQNEYILKVQEDIFKKASESNEPFTAEIKYAFRSNFKSPPENIFLACESEDAVLVQCNGRSISRCGYYIDKSIHLFDISHSLKRNGINEIAMKYEIAPYEQITAENIGNTFESVRNKFFYPVEIESIYIIGDFYLDGRIKCAPGDNYFSVPNEQFIISDFDRRFSISNMNGRWFFRGNVTCDYSFEAENGSYDKISLSLIDAHCALAKVIIDGSDNEFYLCKNEEIDITSMIRTGKNKFKITLYGTNRNLFGPHHFTVQKTPIVGPSTFKGSKGWENFSLNESCGSYWKDDYTLSKDLMLSSVSIKFYLKENRF